VLLQDEVPPIRKGSEAFDFVPTFFYIQHPSAVAAIGYNVNLAPGKQEGGEKST
jgi:hypothetical protein